MGLELDSDLKFHLRQSQLQRWGWWGMGLFLAAALLGGLGDGPLASNSLHNSQATFHYQRLLRRDSPTLLSLQVHSKSPELRLEIARDYLDSFELMDIVPTPVHSESGPNVLIYVFSVQPGRVEVRMQLKPRQIGVIGGQLRLSQPILDKEFDNELWDRSYMKVPAVPIETIRVRFGQVIYP